MRTLIFLVFSLLLVACQPQSLQTDRLLAEWEQQGDLSALATLNQRCVQLAENDLADSVFTICSQLFRRFPEEVSGSPDSLSYAVSRAFYNFHSSAVRPEQRQQFIHITDSLAEVGHPCLTTTYRYYLLAYRCSMNHPDNRSLLEEALSLPKCMDLTQELEFASRLSWELLQTDYSADVYIGMQERAVEAYRQGGRPIDVVSLLSDTGFLYNRVGQYEKGLAYLQEAIEYMEQQGGEPTFGTVTLYGNTANLYARLRLFDKALELNQKAIETSERLSLPNLKCDLLRMRGSIWEHNECYDSTLYYYQSAFDLSEELPNKKVYQQKLKSELANFWVEHHDLYPDKLQEATRRLTEICADTTTTGSVKTTSRFMLGLAQTLGGNSSEGFPRMEEATREFVEQQYNESIDFAYTWLMKMYALHGRDRQLAQLYPAYQAMSDTIHREEKMWAVIAANVRYESGRQEERNRSLAIEIDQKEQTLFYMYTVWVLTSFLFVGSLVYLVKIRRQRRKERALHQNQLRNLLASQKELNLKNERLSQELEVAMCNQTIDRMRQMLNPSLLSGEQELQFRQSFAALYPRYLPGLRGRCPELTKSDELLCMLIYLNQNTDEIALALGISRASVNSARSRIRKKLGLKKEDSLEEALRK